MAQKYEPLVQEDLNVGTEDVWVTAPGGGELLTTQIGIHSFARGTLSPLTNLDVEWTSAVGVTASGNRLTKTAASGAFDAGAISTGQLVSGNGHALFKTGLTPGDAIFGLSNGDTDQDADDIDFAFWVLSTTGLLFVKESGVTQGGSLATYAEGDILAIAVEEGVVQYYLNGVVVHTSVTSPTYPLIIDTSFFYEDAWLEAWTHGFTPETRFLREQAAHRTTWAPGVVGQYVSTTIAVPEASIGDFVLASHDKLTSDLRICGHIYADGIVNVVIHNPTDDDITVQSGTLSVLVFPAIGTVTSGVVTGTVADTSIPPVLFPGELVYMTVDGVPWPGGPATVDANSTYTFSGVPAGDIIVTCDAPFFSGSSNDTCTGSGQLTLDIEMVGQ